jgi:hypothetical protein
MDRVEADFKLIMQLKAELRAANKNLTKTQHSKRTLMLLREFYMQQTGQSAYILLYYPKKLREECKKLKQQTI